jgi:hypothetical protein
MDTEYKVGALEAHVKALQTDVAEIKADQKEQNKMLKALVSDMDQRKGVKKAIAGMVTTGSIFGGLVGWFLEHFVLGKH